MDQSETSKLFGERACAIGFGHTRLASNCECFSVNYNLVLQSQSLERFIIYTVRAYVTTTLSYVFMYTIAVDLRNTVLIATCKCYCIVHCCKSTIWVYVESTYRKGRKIHWVKLLHFTRFSRVPWKFFGEYIFILIQALYLGIV